MAEKETSSDAPKEENPGKNREKPSPPSPSSSKTGSSPSPDRASSVPPTPAPAERSCPETLAPPNSSAVAPAADCRSFSQLLAGAMASPAASPCGTQIVAVPVDAVRVPVVAVPCFIAPASLLESPGFTGQFTMTHQAVLATVTAQAQLQLQSAYPSSSEVLPNSFPQPQPMLSPISPLPLQQRAPPLVSEDNLSTPETEQPPSLSDQKSHSAQIVVKTSSGDGYNWRKYGQKQVKSSDRSRSYYKCSNADCIAKKKVERCPDGRETEIVYRGGHNHDPPPKTRCSKERGPQSGGPSGENETSELPSSELNESDPSTSKAEQNSGNETPEQQLYCSSDCEGDAAVKTEQDPSDEPDPKRRLSENTTSFPAPVLKTVKEPKVVVQTAGDAARVSDGYRWRKYGQKIVKGNPNPRSYYRCTHNGCPVRKHVERASDDAKAIVITYEGKHNHDQPAPKSGTDAPATALLIAAAAATEGELLHTPNSQLDEKPSTELPRDVDGELTGEKALELGGEKALESAQTLLSIGFNSSSAEDGGGANSDGMKCPLFKENRAAVPVQNS